MNNKKVLIGVVTCYYDTNYIRTIALKESLKGSSYDFVHVTNRSRSVKRYFEVVIDLAKTRVTKNPDMYILTFRGYEMLPVVRLITLGKPLIFDEFINPIELVVHEQKIIKNRLLIRVARWGYRLWLKSVQAITTDTLSHADYSAREMNLSRDKYHVLPVGTDESTFDAGKYSQTTPASEKFQIFYYGSMLPLHGVDTVLRAMRLLKGYDDIELMMVGGKNKTKRAIHEAKLDGAQVVHKEWIAYEQLPVAMKRANLCLGGPFGGTVQSQFVITGKTCQQLSLGCPTIIGANQESHVFTDKHDALIVEQVDPEELAETILWAYENRDKLAGIGRNGQRLYREKFSLDILSEKVESLLAQFVKNR